jgi:DMSO/TMAO reductase YedYZ molybdopterin-dependent catalytic subunit
MSTNDRRHFLRNAITSALGLLVVGCDRISDSDTGSRILDSAEGLTQKAQSLLSPSTRLATEFTVADNSPVFKGNGTVMPDTDEYRQLMDNGFRQYRVAVDGLVDAPRSWSLDELASLAHRTQITRHDCVEGWSAIGQWTGTPLSAVLDVVRPRKTARYVVFHCYDKWDDETFYYESIDLEEARHPQTILAYMLNGAALPVANGAPLRLRVERQLGYKHAKYIKRIELVDSFDDIEGGYGGYWEDNGYEWYAGI